MRRDPVTSIETVQRVLPSGMKMVRPETPPTRWWVVVLAFVFGPGMLSPGPVGDALATGSHDSTDYRSGGFAQAPPGFRASVPAAASPLVTRAEREAFLSKGQILASPQRPTGASGRVSVEDGAQKHDAAVETAAGTDPTTRNYRFNVAAYELDKALGLGLVPPSVVRVVDGQAASLTWWIDDFAMSEQDRRKRKVEPPDLEKWHRQIQAVRVFDELIANAYRDVSPPLYLNSVWDNLLITRDWTVWIIDHTGAFRVRRHLEYPETLTRCERAVLGRLRQLTRERLQQVVGTYLSSEQLDALELRRQLLVKHFDEQISIKGEAVVLYDLPTR